MNRTIPVRDEVIYLGNDVTVEPPAGSPVQDVPPFEIKDTPPREPLPWVAPQPSRKEAFNDGSADA